jgi:hypothetical protein
MNSADLNSHLPNLCINKTALYKNSKYCNYKTDVPDPDASINKQKTRKTLISPVL